MPLTNLLRATGAATATAALCLTTTIALATPKVGAPAPQFIGIDSKGQTVKLSDFKGKTVVLEWTNHGCPYVQKHYGSGNMQNLQKTTTADGVVWLSVVSSAPGRQGHVDGKAADKLTQSRDAKPTAVLLDPDGKIGKLYGARATPHMFVISKDGTLAYMGAIDDKPSANPADVTTAVNYVTKALGQIAAGKPADPAVTRAYGCSVKYGS